MLGAFCLTEPHVGWTPPALRTTAVKEGEEVCDQRRQAVHHQRQERPGGHRHCRDGQSRRQERHERLHGADQQPRLPGWRGWKTKLGQHSSDTAQINLDDCRIPAENLIGAEGEGYEIAPSALEGGASASPRKAWAWRAVRFECALQYSKERERLWPAHLQPPGRGLSPGRLRHADRGGPPANLARGQPARCGAALSCKKRPWPSSLPAKWPSACAAPPSRHWGGFGVVNDFPVERIYRDVRVCQI